MYPLQIRESVQSLRKAGKTYGEILKILDVPIAKSTLSDWCKEVELSGFEKVRLEAKQLQNSERGLFVAWTIRKKRRQEYLLSVQQRTMHLPALLKDREVAKIALGMLYLGEGSKNPRHGSLMFGNSDPGVVSLFLSLLRYCYVLDESKLRCTVQCRADQDTKALERFWLEVTEIPMGS